MRAMDGRFSRRSRRVAYENPWITVWHDDVDRPDGTPGIYGVVHFANLAAGVVAIDAEDRIVLVRQHRYTLDADSWEIPEGGVPDGEVALDGARRELREETGVEAARWQELLRMDLSNSVTDEQAVIYLATDLTHGIGRPRADRGLDDRLGTVRRRGGDGPGRADHRRDERRWHPAGGSGPNGRGHRLGHQPRHDQ
jgi:8-oxo-dGTP pyrophosphatase MutT (NUDIX family)